MESISRLLNDICYICWTYTTRNEAFTDNIFDTDKPIAILTTCRLYKVVGIALLVKMENVVGINIVGTEQPIQTTCPRQRVFETDFRLKRKVLL